MNTFTELRVWMIVMIASFACPHYLLCADSDAFVLLVNNSKKFNDTVGRFPTRDNRIVTIAGADTNKKSRIVEQAQDSYPLMHPEVRNHVERFLAHKKTQGSIVEKSLYQDMTVLQFIVRLLKQRPLMFMTEYDQYLLRGAQSKGSGGFEKIGTEAEQKPLVLKDYLSYDEMYVAALVGMSCPTYFINKGDRANNGVKAVDASYELEGIYSGLVGARFEKPGFMEWQHMIVTEKQNREENGYGINGCKEGLLSLWAQLYGMAFPTFDEAKSDKTGRYILCNKGTAYFDTHVYKKRIKLVVEPFLIDANRRSAAEGKKAYVHVVGLGLGVWQIDSSQAQYMLEAYAGILKNSSFPYIADIDFSWFSKAFNHVGGIKNGEYCKENNKHIKIHFSERNPADKLMGVDNGKLLVACYAWDGNAYPGNEYWAGMLAASGDPAAACCSTIAELQNPMINNYIEQNVYQEKFAKEAVNKSVERDSASQKSWVGSLWQKTVGRITSLFKYE